MPSRRVRSRPARAEETDAALVARCAAGDEAAWRELVRRYRRLVYTIPYRMGLDPADADEVFQITFTRLAQRIGALERPGRVRAWLVTTSRRVALNLVARRPPVEDAERALATTPDPADLPGEEVERLEEQALVRRALARLGGRCRKLLELLYYPGERGSEGMSYEEAAAELGMPLGSVGPTRIRCLKKLLVEYRAVAGEDEDA